VSGTQVSNEVMHDLRAICGDENTRERPNGGLYVSPSRAEEVAAVLSFANGHGLSVGPAGGSTERSAGELQTDIVLHLNQLTQIEHYDCGDLTVGVGAGMTIAQLNEMVSADKLMFAGDPPSPGRCTVGGMLATANHGPLRHGYGAVRDYCIGVRFVTGDGRRAKGGGRVVKNVAGYDLMKLLIGSYGTLAVITSASFKLFPAPRQTRTFLAEFKTAKEALVFRDQVVRSPLSPMCLELVSPLARKLMRPETADDAWVICVRASGSDVVLARYRRELGAAITNELGSDSENAMWCAVQNFPDSAKLSGDDTPISAIIQITVPPGRMLPTIEALDRLLARGEIRVAMTGRVAVGHVQAVVWKGNRNTPDVMPEVVDGLRKSAGDELAIRVSGASNPWPLGPASLTSMRTVKRALDPNNVLRARNII